MGTNLSVNHHPRLAASVGVLALGVVRRVEHVLRAVQGNKRKRKFSLPDRPFVALVRRERPPPPFVRPGIYGAVGCHSLFTRNTRRP